MGTTRNTKAAAKAKADGAPAKKKTVKKPAAKAKAADKPAKKKTTKTTAAKPAKARALAAAPTPKKRVVKAVAAEAPARKAVARAGVAPARGPRRAAAEVPGGVAAPTAGQPAAARDPREERRARLEEKLALRSAALRQQQAQRGTQQAPLAQPAAPLAAEPPRAQAPQARPQQLQLPVARADAAVQAARFERPAPRPDLPFDPTSFGGRRPAEGTAPRPANAGSAQQRSPIGPAPSPDHAGAEGDEAGEGGGHRRRRRRRRRRRGGGEPGAELQGATAPQAVAVPLQAGQPERAPVSARPPEDAAGFAESGEGLENGGRKRRRRRRRRRGGGVDAGAELAQPPVPAPQPRAQPPQPRSDDDLDGARRGKRRRRGRDFDGPVPWDPQREAPAVNILPDRDPFSDLVSIDPEERIDLETDTEEMSMRVVDLVTPFGKGQRALIVAPPKTGKTTLLMQLARAISENHPEMELIVMLVDERPEEVTAFRRAGYGEIMASSNDEPTHRHLKLTQHVIDIAKRRVLEGKDVCILLDSITRMARAHNVASTGHRTLSGGLDSRALERPKRFFGAARKILNGGSLTVLATALIDTGSRMDEVIFQEFKGTGNAELQLDRRLAERRIWPAIDIQRSGTRKEEKLFEPLEYEGIVALRRALSGKPPAEAMQMLLARLAQYRTNREFLLDVARKAATAL